MVLQKYSGAFLLLLAEVVNPKFYSDSFDSIKPTVPGSRDRFPSTINPYNRDQVIAKKMQTVGSRICRSSENEARHQTQTHPLFRPGAESGQ